MADKTEKKATDYAKAMKTQMGFARLALESVIFNYENCGNEGPYFGAIDDWRCAKECLKLLKERT